MIVELKSPFGGQRKSPDLTYDSAIKWIEANAEKFNACYLTIQDPDPEKRKLMAAWWSGFVERSNSMRALPADIQALVRTFPHPLS